MKFLLSIQIVFLVYFLMGENPAYGAEGEMVRILHTNDIHGRMVEGEGFGFAKLKTLIDSNCEGDCLLVDAGDTFHGTPFAQASKGEVAVSLMNDLHYDAFVPGNHDFNYGFGHLLHLRKQARFVFLNGNLFYKGRKEQPFSPFIIKTVATKKIGLFGLTTTEAITKTNPNNVKEIELRNPFEQAANIVDQLKQAQVDLIVAVVHLGMEGSPETSKQLAEKVPDIDVIIDGHSHTLLPTGHVAENNTLLASTGAHLQALGLVTIEYDNDQLIKKAQLLKPSSTTREHLVTKKKLHIVAERINKDGKRVVGFTPVALIGDRQHVRVGETNLTQFLTDAIRKKTNADISLLNGGAIRSSIPKGTVTKADLQSAFPFNSSIVTVDVSGQVLVDMIEHGIRGYPLENGKFPHVSGMKVTVKWEEGTPVVDAIKLDGGTFNPSSWYTVATSDFIYSGGDGYPIQPGRFIHKYGPIQDGFVDYMKTQNPIATIHNRIVGLETNESGKRRD
ncbi:bifunctional UDP-sugar hydrolase/5'-nucleotidase [Shouchella miscanthi]|uniref:Bifunctional UDP-sugar hydrolase/5'-nucleotidase n=1 Tax=Shouchella miscanthi TaxID=2598861 RepID=A0ABU6NFF2_9BACI|nr:bifunctional UDP-sugar hydrolase/5'-nucleotidase [Shouchella miscanthi]